MSTNSEGTFDKLERHRKSPKISRDIHNTNLSRVLTSILSVSRVPAIPSILSVVVYDLASTLLNRLLFDVLVTTEAKEIFGEMVKELTCIYEMEKDRQFSSLFQSLWNCVYLLQRIGDKANLIVHFSFLCLPRTKYSPSACLFILRIPLSLPQNTGSTTHALRPRAHTTRSHSANTPRAHTTRSHHALTPRTNTPRANTPREHTTRTHHAHTTTRTHHANTPRAHTTPSHHANTPHAHTTRTHNVHITRTHHAHITRTPREHTHTYVHTHHALTPREHTTRTHLTPRPHTTSFFTLLCFAFSLSQRVFVRTTLTWDVRVLACTLECLRL